MTITCLSLFKPHLINEVDYKQANIRAIYNYNERNRYNTSVRLLMFILRKYLEYAS